MGDTKLSEAQASLFRMETATWRLCRSFEKKPKKKVNFYRHHADRLTGQPLLTQAIKKLKTLPYPHFHLDLFIL